MTTFCQIIITIAFLQASTCQESFQLTFQKSEGLSSEEWAEFKGAFPHLSAFTSCHWEKMDFLNLKFQYVWNYCTIRTLSSKMQCIQFGYEGDDLTVGRGIKVILSFGEGNNKIIQIKVFKQRSWNHFCWTFEGKTGENKVYLNGKLAGTATFDEKREAYGSYEVSRTSFLIGQEPDTFRGQYDKFQAFRGAISELNFWDFILSEGKIGAIANCNERADGNVIHWKENNFKFNDLKAEALTDFKRLCLPEENWFIFPQKYTYISALALCKAHGGYLYSPRSMQGNQGLLEEVLQYKQQCWEQATGNILWLGATTRNYELFWSGQDANISKGNFTNWKNTPFYKDNKCTIMEDSGKWFARKDCQGFELCPVCGFIGHPILTLKGDIFPSSA